MLNTDSSIEKIQTLIKSEIDEYCVKAYDDGHRTHLGASVIGDDCSRKLWYIFRWFHHKKFSARMLRLFQRGKLEELRFIEYLRGAGFGVFTLEEGQERISDCNGHFGGSLDAEVTMPDTEEFTKIQNNFGIMIAEFKTKGTGSGFVNLKEKGVKVVSPEHYAQMCIYGYKRQRTHALYISANKNDDDIHVEIVDLDWGYAQDLIRKAETIIYAERPPNKISMSSAFFKCKMCDFTHICHGGMPPEKNCRSCFYAKPSKQNKSWICTKWQNIIPDKFIPEGCDHWETFKANE